MSILHVCEDSEKWRYSPLRATYPRIYDNLWITLEVIPSTLWLTIFLTPRAPRASTARPTGAPREGVVVACGRGHRAMWWWSCSAGAGAPDGA
jgi:hypothetical protein